MTTSAEIIFHRRVRLLELADELGNVAMACRRLGISRTRYYQWRRLADAYGLEALMSKARRRPQLANATPTPGRPRPDLAQAAPLMAGTAEMDAHPASDSVLELYRGVRRSDCQVARIARSPRGRSADEGHGRASLSPERPQSAMGGGDEPRRSVPLCGR